MTNNISTSIVHTYHPAVAAEVGVNAAVLFYNICFWVAQNEANERNCVNGKYWTYNSVKAFCQLFPEFTQKQISTALKRLEESKYIESAYLNPDPLKREKWYAVCNKGKCFLPVSKMQSAEKETDNNIYNNINNSNTDNKQTDNNFTDNSHKDKGRNINSVNAEVETPLSEGKRVADKPESKMQKYLDKKADEEDMIKRLYHICTNNYSEEQAEYVYSIMEGYFEKYTNKTGLIHPILSDRTLKRLADKVLSFSDEYCFGHDSSYFEDMTDMFLSGNFGELNGYDTDYHISAFLSDGIIDKLVRRLD